MDTIALRSQPFERRSIMERYLLSALLLSIPLALTGQTQPKSGAPIIDVHLHAFAADDFGKPGLSVCPGNNEKLWLGNDPQQANRQLESCPQALVAPLTDGELMRQSLSALEQFNIRAVASGQPEQVEKWKAASPNRIIPALLFGFAGGGTSPSAMRDKFRHGDFSVLGEVVTQYEGISPSDLILDPYLAMAEQMDIPVGIHMGLGPPGVAYQDSSNYRAKLSNPLLLEDALIRHPKLRVYVMHAGWPMLDEMISLLQAHPQVYVDVAVIDWYIPRKEFHSYLRRLVEAGFGKRVMFGSDQMLWPQAISIAIEGINSAEFLTPEQKRDILYNNAARFFRLQQVGTK